MRELLSNKSLFVGQLYEDNSLALRARDLIFLINLQQFTARADLFFLNINANALAFVTRNLIG